MLRRRTALFVSAVLLSMRRSHASADPAAIKIGILDDMSGVYAALNGSGGVVSANLAVQDFGGTLLGRPVQVIAADDGNKPDIGLSIARAWFDVDDVPLIAGLGNSAVALGVQDLARQRKRIDIVSGGTSFDLTGRACSPTGFHWTHDSRAYASTIPRAMIDRGAKTFFFVTVDYTFGQVLEADSTLFIRRLGGSVIGSAKHPLGTTDFSSYLLQAQASKADVVMLANGGTDLVNAIKTAGEFGIQAGGQKLAAPLLNVTDIDALGLEATKGLITATPYFPGLNARTRAFAERFMPLHGGVAPTPNQAGVYSGVLHWLQAAAAAGTLDGPTVAERMRAMPVNDMMSDNVQVRRDGRVMRNFYVVSIKSPTEKKFPYDYYQLLQTVSGEDAFRPLAEGGCALGSL